MINLFNSEANQRITSPTFLGDVIRWLVFTKSLNKKE